MNNLTYKKDDVYFILGSFYQSNLSNTSNIDLDKVATLSKSDMYAVSYKLRPTYAFNKHQNLFDLTGVKEISKKEKPPLFVPLGLFLLESYPFLQSKVDSAIVCFEFDKKENPDETLYAAITIHKGTIYCLDGKGEFIGTSDNLILYLKEIIQKLKIRDIHSTVECFQLIEDTFLNQEINFRKIGLGKTKEFAFDSNVLFWDKKYKLICEKINFYKIYTKKEKRNKQIKIFSQIFAGLIVIVGGGVGSYYYFKEDAPPPPPPKPAPVYIKVFDYNSLIKDCFDRAGYFLKDNGSWGLTSYNCDLKSGGVLKFINYGDAANNIVNSDDFIKSYKLLPNESKSLNFSSGSGKASVISITIPIKDKGIEKTRLKFLSNDELRAKVINITKLSESDDFKINLNTDKTGNINKMEIISNFSPIYLQNKYNIFSKLYIENLSLKIDDKTANPTWQISIDVTNNQPSKIPASAPIVNK